MSERTFQLEIVSLDRPLFSGEVTSLVAPGTEGSFGVLAHHAPLIASLAIGEIDIYDISHRLRSLAITGGFFEMAENKAVILADSGEWSEEIDLVRAEKAYQRAHDKLINMFPGMDRERARKSLEKARIRIKLARSRAAR